MNTHRPVPGHSTDTDSEIVFVRDGVQAAGYTGDQIHYRTPMEKVEWTRPRRSS